MAADQTAKAEALKVLNEALAAMFGDINGTWAEHEREDVAIIAAALDRAREDAIDEEREACIRACQNVTLRYAGQPLHDACIEAIQKRRKSHAK